MVFFIITQLFLADSLYAHGYFDKAVVEYKREFFFYPDQKNDVAKRIRYAVSLSNVNWSEGFDELNLITDEFQAIKDDSKIRIAEQYLRQGYYYSASELLKKTDNYRLLGYAMLWDERYLDARDLFAEHDENALVQEVDDYMRVNKKSELKAVFLSFIIPGSGDIYAGKTGRGILSFLVNAGTVYLLYDAIKDKRYVDGGLIFIFLFNRFYTGSIANAQRAARERNEREKEKWLKRMEEKYFEAILTLP